MIGCKGNQNDSWVGNQQCLPEEHSLKLVMASKFIKYSNVFMLAIELFFHLGIFFLHINFNNCVNLTYWCFNYINFYVRKKMFSET